MLKLLTKLTAKRQSYLLGVNIIVVINNAITVHMPWMEKRGLTLAHIRMYVNKSCRCDSAKLFVYPPRHFCWYSMVWYIKHISMTH